MTTHLMARYNSSPHTKENDGYTVFVEYCDCVHCLKEYLAGWQQSKSERAEWARNRIVELSK